jgi:nucleoid DNA-binding protein
MKGLLMTKRDMARVIAEEQGIPTTAVLAIIQRVLDGIIETLMSEGRIELRNFGVFEVRKRKPRQARNLRTGEKVSVPEKVVVTFKTGREMEERVGQLVEMPSQDQRIISSADETG